MGRLIEGKWSNAEGRTINAKGEYVRPDANFRRWLCADDSTPHPAQAARYLLMVAHNCGWSQRTIIARNLKKLQHLIPMAVAHFRRDDEGWWFPEGVDDDLAAVDGRFHLHHVFTQTKPDYTGSVTVPVLWDRERREIVSDESADIIRMFDCMFEGQADPTPTLYPADLRDEIDEVNAWTYPFINNGVYRSGFARSQEAYEKACGELFEALDRVEQRLSKHRYLVGDRLTEADLRLFPTLVRFDAVYYSHFKCNRQRIVDFPCLWPYLRDLYQTPGFGQTVDIDLYKRGYYGNSQRLNPSGIIPVGPQLDFEAAHDRATRSYPG